jgi:AAA family ATP:ADP antiporter
MTPVSTTHSSGPVNDSTLLARSAALFINFLLIILAYYQVKAASRSLLIEFAGAESLPWVWIGSALVLLTFIGTYNRLVARFSRIQVILGSLLCFAGLLLIFWLTMERAGIVTAILFYIFVDIFSVILVEQFWSLTDSVTRLQEGRKSYWFVGTGGLIGGIAGGATAAALIRFTPMGTVDLLLSCAAMLAVTAAVNLWIWRRGMYRELSEKECIKLDGQGLRALLGSRYLLLIAAILCLSQLVQPVVEYQFLKTVSDYYTELDARTQFISGFFSVLGMVSVGVNVLLTPLLHRYLGAIAGLLVQPVLLLATSLGFILNPTLMVAAVMKISDRGLSYSVNRASKELLYIPVDPINTYQSKAWIDMLGYRLFKVLGSGLILLATQLLPVQASVAQLSWITLGVCTLWLLVIALLASEYRAVKAAIAAA